MSTALPLANLTTDFWNHHLVAHHRQGVFLVLVGFVGSFAFIRMSTRMIRAEVSWWPGNVESESGLHVHHLVFGIITMMVAGTLGFAAAGHSPLLEICAFLFGVGAGLTIDEFALWVYLEDVYWADEGRSSIDATVIAAALIGLIVVGANPFEFGAGPEEIIGGIVSALLLIAFVAICFLKGRRLHGALGILFAPLAIYGAWRIGKPDSAWARRRYGERRPKKQTKAEARFHPGRRTDRVKDAFRDMVGGKPSEGVAAVTEEAKAATREAGEEMRTAGEEMRHAAERVVHPEDPDDPDRSG
jgi:lysyl-tRNA synthetase, class II